MYKHVCATSTLVQVVGCGALIQSDSAAPIGVHLNVRQNTSVVKRSLGIIQVDVCPTVITVQVALDAYEMTTSLVGTDVVGLSVGR